MRNLRHTQYSLLVIRPFDQVDPRNFCVVRHGNVLLEAGHWIMARGPYATLKKGAPQFRLRQERKRSRMTQAELAEELELDDSTVSRRERGLQDFPVSDLLRMAELFGCAPGHLIKDGDGLTAEERALIQFLRDNPVHKKILLSQLDVLKETMPPIAAE